MWRRLRTTLYTILILPVFCLAQSNNDDTQTQVFSMVKSYCTAVESQNVKEVISYYWQSPDFLFYVNGEMKMYDEWVAQIKSMLPYFKKVNLSFDTLYIRKLSSNRVIVAGPFQESFIDKEGIKASFKIDVTWVLIKQNNNYKIAYATGVYQPLNKEK
jgi:ketosteroid isomerase-like protein